MPHDGQRVHSQAEGARKGSKCAGYAERVSGRGKGSHQILCFGSAFTVIRNPKDELKTGTFHAMCIQLGIKAKDL